RRCSTGTSTACWRACCGADGPAAGRIGPAHRRPAPPPSEGVYVGGGTGGSLLDRAPRAGAARRWRRLSREEATLLDGPGKGPSLVFCRARGSKPGAVHRGGGVYAASTPSVAIPAGFMTVSRLTVVSTRKGRFPPSFQNFLEARFRASSG